MTAVVRARLDGAVPVLTLAVAALALRGVGLLSFLVPVAGAAGVLLVQGRTAAVRRDAATWLLVTTIGASAFALVRIALPGPASHATTFALLAGVVAGVCEEIVLRRGLYGVLERWGPVAAVAVTAVVFALVHVPMYGWSVVPIDAAAGLVFGWQRWATGTWTSPAVTHAAANVLGSI